MKRVWVFPLLFVFSLFLYAKDASITISLTKYKCAIGDRIFAEVKVITDSQSRVEFDLQKETDEKIILEKFKTDEKNLPENMKLTTLSFYIQPFKLGRIKIGKIKVKVNDRVYDEKIPEIEVVSILPDSKKDINPLKPQKSIAPDYSYLKKYFKYGLIILIAAVLLYFLLKKLYARLKGTGKKEMEKPEILAPPCEEVKDLLSALLSKTYLKEGRTKEFFVELSEIAKRFLGRVFQFDYDSKTSEEIMIILKPQIKIDEERIIKEFFEFCDLVKFAKYRPEQSEINTTVNLLYQLIEIVCKRFDTKLQGEENVQV